MDRTLLLLRALTLTASVLLVVGLFARITLLRRAASRASRAGWLVIAGVQCALLMNYGGWELFAVVGRWVDSAPIRELGKRFYYAAYLANGMLDAMLPAALLVLSVRVGWGRKGSMLLACGIAAAGAISIGRGALWDWGILLTATQIISLLGLGGYLAFCALFILKRLSGIDLYLASFMAVAATFNLVLPIQEVIFQSVGREFAAGIWHLNQFLQVVRYGAQFAIVLASIRSVRQEMAPPAVYSVRGS
jgi:hypothetical protein